LSKLIKSTYVISLDDLKRLELYAKQQAAVKQNLSAGDEKAERETTPDETTLSLRDQVLRDAESTAEERVRQAAQEADQLRSEATAEIENWWQMKRDQDLETVEAARQAGFEQGYQEGYTQVEADLKQQLQKDLNDAHVILEQAYRMKEQIIQEAEPFLVELSCAIAEKIIAKQLSVSPDLSVELIRRTLSRRREQGVITLCVSPGQLLFVQAAREELTMAIDSQAELQILPDATIRDHGCVIRSSFGSIDARIDTQLDEIKRELIGLALQSEEMRNVNEQHTP
jgi:flagellar assembly protein FliH